VSPLAKRIVACWIATDIVWCTLLVWVLRRDQQS
jgi:hypothetical protein